MNTYSPLVLAETEVRRTRKVYIIYGSSLLALGVLFLFLPGGGLDDVQKGLVVGFFLLAGTYKLVWGGRGANLQLLRALREQPQTITWFYRQDFFVDSSFVNSIKSPSCNIIICAEGLGRKRASVNVPNKRADALMGAIRQLAPQAIEGFTQERDALYRRNPETFRTQALKLQTSLHGR